MAKVKHQVRDGSANDSSHETDVSSVPASQPVIDVGLIAQCNKPLRAAVERLYAARKCVSSHHFFV